MQRKLMMGTQVTKRLKSSIMKWKYTMTNFKLNKRKEKMMKYNHSRKLKRMKPKREKTARFRPKKTKLNNNWNPRSSLMTKNKKPLRHKNNLKKPNRHILRTERLKRITLTQPARREAPLHTPMLSAKPKLIYRTWVRRKKGITLRQALRGSRLWTRVSYSRWLTWWRIKIWWSKCIRRRGWRWVMSSWTRWLRWWTRDSLNRRQRWCQGTQTLAASS